MHSEVPDGLVHVMGLARGSIFLGEQLREGDRELHRTQREMQVGSGLIVEAQLLL